MKEGNFEKSDENLKLIRAAQKNDKESLEKLILENSGLIWSIVKKFSNRGYELEDLYQIGCIGFVKAIQKFDESYNVKLSTYAVPIIIGEIKRFIRDDGLIKVSRSLKELSTKAFYVKEILSNELNREPTINEIAEKLGVELEEVILALESSQKISSLDEVVYQDDGSPIYAIDKISDENKEIGWVEKIVLKDALRKLSPRERKIIFFRYFKDKTQTEIAEILGISQVQVSRIEKKIIEKIKKEFLSEA